MQINRVGFSEILPDNESEYFSRFIGIVESVDELSSLEITKLANSYHFRIAASLPKYNNLLLKEILKFHNIYGIKLNISKSIKSSATLAFYIDLY